MTPFPVKDMWLAAFAMERGLATPRIERDNAQVFWVFEAEAMRAVMSEWTSGTAKVDVRQFHAAFLWLKHTTRG